MEIDLKQYLEMSQKSKHPQFKKLIAEMDEVALREELLKLYTKIWPKSCFFTTKETKNLFLYVININY